MGQRENSLTDRDVIVKLSIKVIVQQSEKVGGVKRRRVELVELRVKPENCQLFQVTSWKETSVNRLSDFWK